MTKSRWSARLGGAVLLAAVVSMATTARAEYMQVEAEEVPVDRVIASCEKLAKAEPKNFWYRLALARAHAMTYALKSETCQARKSDGRAWFGYEPRAIPFEVKPTDDAAKRKKAKEHLATAVGLYAKLVADFPKQPVGLLGHAWCLDQSGEREAAIEAYRKAVDVAHGMEVRGAMDPLITVEAVGYLIPLLDAKKDAAEIAALKKKKAEVEAAPRAVTPIAIPLTDALAPERLVDPQARVRFDLDGSGHRRTWRWLRSDAGWLVWDPRGRGDIRSGLQMFGNVTFWMFWENGYQALRVLDVDGDGWVRGAEARGLAIWRDLDADGESDPGEVRPLGAWGIVGLSWRASVGPDGMPRSEGGVMLEDGRRRTSVDLILEALAEKGDARGTTAP